MSGGACSTKPRDAAPTSGAARCSDAPTCRGSALSACPSELAQQQLIAHLPSREPGRFTLIKGKRSVTVRVSGRLGCNDGVTSVEAAVQGLGIVGGPEFEVSQEVLEKRLVPVLVGRSTVGSSLHAVTPPRRHVSSKVRTFIDFVSERWKTPPWRIL